MAGDHMRRTLGIVELLARSPRGLPLQAVADALEIPKSAAHRLLGELERLGWSRKGEEDGRHHLTIRPISIVFGFLGEVGVPGVAQPILDRLARESGEMVRLGVIDGDEQYWVAKAQGAGLGGLRLDPDMGARARLTCTSTGLAWLAAVGDDEIHRLVRLTGFEKEADRGPNAPRDLPELLERIRQIRRDGYARAVDTAHAGTSAMAAAVRDPATGRVVGTISIAGPTFRLTEERMRALAPSLLAAAEELAGASPSFAWIASRGPLSTTAARSSGPGPSSAGRRAPPRPGPPR